MHKLEFRDVTLRYDDGRHGADGLLALESLSLVVDAGESLAIIGPSGCGKSTLLSIIAASDVYKRQAESHPLCRWPLGLYVLRAARCSSMANP